MRLKLEAGFFSLDNWSRSTLVYSAFLFPRLQTGSVLTVIYNNSNEDNNPQDRSNLGISKWRPKRNLKIMCSHSKELNSIRNTSFQF